MADTSSIDKELTGVNNSITDTQNNLSNFQSPTSYLDLLGKVASASYNSNADLVQYRQAARRQLFGEQGYKPENYSQLSPEQQASIRTSSRAGLLAGIQAANETEQNRGTRIENLLATEGGRYKDTRDSLSTSLDRLMTRRGQLETQKSQAQAESRQFFFDMVKNYPDLVKNLTPDEQNKLFQGTADKKLMDKVSLYAKQADAQNRIKTMEKKGYIIGYDPVTGKQVYKIDTGIRDAGSGGGDNRTDIQKLRARLPKGYDIKLQGGTDGGVDYYGPNGKITREQWTNSTGVNWQEAAQAIGSLNAQDYVNPAKTGGVDSATVNSKIGQLKSNGWTNSQIGEYIRVEYGVNPADYGIK